MRRRFLGEDGHISIIAKAAMDESRAEIIMETMNPWGVKNMKEKFIAK